MKRLFKPSNSFSKVASGNNSAGSDRKLNLDFSDAYSQKYKKSNNFFNKTAPIMKAFQMMKKASKKYNDDFLDLDEPKYVKDGEGPIEVYVRIIFVRMGTINTLLERFDCHAFIECYWDDSKLFETIIQEAHLIGISGVQLRNRLNSYLSTFKFNPYEYWTPRIHLENAIGEVKEERTYKVEVVYKKNYPDQPSSLLTLRVYEQKFIKGIFYERLELYDFPLDMQELSITVSSQLSEREVKFVENTNDTSSISTEVFLNEQEWKLFNYVVPKEKRINDTFKGYYRSGLSVSAFVARKAGYFFNKFTLLSRFFFKLTNKTNFYYYSAYLLIFIITGLGFVPFSIDASKPHFRMSVAGVLILTQVNFRWIITQRIPSVGYLTSIDKYAIGNLFFLVTFAFWHAIIGSTIFNEDNDYRALIDSYALVTVSVGFVIYTLYSIFKIMYMSRQIDNLEKQSI